MSRRPQPAHYRGAYTQQARIIRQAANANPNTRCWRCGQTLAEAQQTRPDTKWTAGHVNDGEVGGELRPEHSHCNYSAGGRRGNAIRHNHTKTILRW